MKEFLQPVRSSEVFLRPQSSRREDFPPGTFIPTPGRVLAIIQLCLAFTAILSALGEPFMGELFTVKSKKLLYESVISQEDLFSALPRMDQELLEHNYKQLTAVIQTPFLEKGKRALKILLYDLPAFERAWILFSVILPILLLLKIEGATTACWLLPLIILGSLTDVHYPNEEKREEKLFPSEEILVRDYLKEPLSPKISEQYQQLLKGWHLYLIHEWAEEVPSEDPILSEQQVKKGNFYFTLTRLKEEKEQFSKKSTSPLLIGIYLAWNLFFAWFINSTFFRTGAGTYLKPKLH